MSKAKQRTTVKYHGRNVHILQPGERLLRDGSYRRADGTVAKGPVVDSVRAAAIVASQKPSKKKTVRKTAKGK